jgi:hypothetical protein
MSGPPMQSEPRPEGHHDYYVRFLGILHDMSHQDIQHFTKAIEEHIKQYGGRPYEIEFEEIA